MVQMLKTRKQLNKLAAHTHEAREAVQRRGEISARRSAIILAETVHGAAPHSFISTYMGIKGIDFYIVLNDERGQKAALSIEFGRNGGNTDKNGRPVTPSRAAAPLRRGAGIQ